MAIDDNTSYELKGSQIKDLANKIKAKAADNIFVGASSAAPGSKGLVPVPQAGDNTKFLCGDGTWATAGGSQGGAIFYTAYKDVYNHNSIWDDTPGSNIKLFDSYGSQISPQQLYDAYSLEGSVAINGCVDPTNPVDTEAVASVIHATDTDGIYYYFWMVIVTSNGGDEIIRCLKGPLNGMYFSLDHDIPLQSGGGGGISSVLLYATDRSQYLQGHSQFQGRPYPNYLVLFPKQPVANTTNLLIKVDDLKAIDITGSRIYVSCDFQQEQRFSSQYSGYVYGEIVCYAHTTRNGTPQEGFLFMYPGEAGRWFARAITGTVENGTGAVLWELNSAY